MFVGIVNVCRVYVASVVVCLLLSYHRRLFGSKKRCYHCRAFGRTAANNRHQPLYKQIHRKENGTTRRGKSRKSVTDSNVRVLLFVTKNDNCNENDKMAGGVILENLSGKKLFVLVSSLLFCQLACFLIGGLVGKLSHDRAGIPLKTFLCPYSTFIFFFCSQLRHRPPLIWCQPRNVCTITAILGRTSGAKENASHTSQTYTKIVLSPILWPMTLYSLFR